MGHMTQDTCATISCERWGTAPFSLSFPHSSFLPSPFLFPFPSFSLPSPVIEVGVWGELWASQWVRTHPNLQIRFGAFRGKRTLFVRVINIRKLSFNKFSMICVAHRHSDQLRPTKQPIYVYLNTAPYIPYAYGKCHYYTITVQFYAMDGSSPKILGGGHCPISLFITDSIFSVLRKSVCCLSAIRVNWNVAQSSEPLVFVAMRSLSVQL